MMRPHTIIFALALLAAASHALRAQDDASEVVGVATTPDTGPLAVQGGSTPTRESPATPADAGGVATLATTMPAPYADPGLCPVVDDMLGDYCKDWPQDAICQP